MLVKAGAVSELPATAEIQRLQQALQQQRLLNDALHEQLGKLSSVKTESATCVQCRALKLALQDQILQNQRLKAIAKQVHSQAAEETLPTEVFSRGVQCDALVEASSEMFYLQELQRLQDEVARLQDGSELRELREISKRQSEMLQIARQ